VGPIHQHCIVKGYSSDTIKDPEVMKKLLVDLVHFVGMKPVTEPQAVFVTDAGNEGLTFSINLSTSHIAGHIWDVTGLVMFDLYSCTCFDTIDLINFITKRFKLEHVWWTVMDRLQSNLYDNQLILDKQ